MKVRAKKSLGQHFLKDENIAAKIVSSLLPVTGEVVEVGPGTGVLTRYLLDNRSFHTTVIEIDGEAVAYLKERFPGLSVVHADFLQTPLDAFGTFSLIGNLPYYISAPVFFRILEYRERIPQVVCMIQKEVAERITSRHGNKTYGILSVLLQTFYHIEYLFTVSEHVFVPPPKVKSAVIRLLRKDDEPLPCEVPFFFTVVKTAFNQRRKTLRNALKPLAGTKELRHPFLSLRAEQLSPQDFVALTVWLRQHILP